MQPNPPFIAQEAQHLAQKAEAADCKVFQKVALVSMSIMAAAGASQILLALWKELMRKEEQERGPDQSS